MPELADRETRKFWAQNNTPGKKGFQSTSSTTDSLGRTAGTTGDSLGAALGLTHAPDWGKLGSRPVKRLTREDLGLRSGHTADRVKVDPVSSVDGQPVLSGPAARRALQLDTLGTVSARGVLVDKATATAIRSDLRGFGYQQASKAGRGTTWTVHDRGGHRVLVTAHAEGSYYRVDSFRRGPRLYAADKARIRLGQTLQGGKQVELDEFLRNGGSINSLLNETSLGGG